MKTVWLNWAKELQKIGQDGLLYSQHPGDTERYEKIRHIAAEIFAAGSETDIIKIKDLFTQENGVITPKVAVRAVIFKNNKLLLVKNHYQKGWTFPGGFAGVNESPSEAVTREVIEETGISVKPTRILAVYYHQFSYDLYTLFFNCKIKDKAINFKHKTWEIDDIGLFTQEEIKKLITLHDTINHVDTFFEHYFNNELKTEFD